MEEHKKERFHQPYTLNLVIRSHWFRIVLPMNNSDSRAIKKYGTIANDTLIHTHMHMKKSLSSSHQGPLAGRMQQQNVILFCDHAQLLGVGKQSMVASIHNIDMPIVSHSYIVLQCVTYIYFSNTCIRTYVCICNYIYISIYARNYVLYVYI